MSQCLSAQVTRTSLGFLVWNLHAPAHDIPVQIKLCRDCKTTLVVHANDETGGPKSQVSVVCLEGKQEDLNLDDIPQCRQDGARHKSAFCADVANKARSVRHGLTFADQFEGGWCAQLISSCSSAFSCSPHRYGTRHQLVYQKAAPDAEFPYYTNQPKMPGHFTMLDHLNVVAVDTDS